MEEEDPTYIAFVGWAVRTFDSSILRPLGTLVVIRMIVSKFGTYLRIHLVVYHNLLLNQTLIWVRLGAVSA
jgi:hypothetical protein